MNFALADPKLLHAFWPVVCDDIAFCLKQDRDEVWPEDVYTALRIGTAHLVIATDPADGEYVGMTVLVEHEDTYDPRAKTLHVWLCKVGEGGVTQEGQAFIEQLARSRGCRWVTLRSTRAAFERWGRARGFELGDIELRKELD